MRGGQGSYDLIDSNSAVSTVRYSVQAMVTSPQFRSGDRLRHSVGQEPRGQREALPARECLVVRHSTASCHRRRRQDARLRLWQQHRERMHAVIEISSQPDLIVARLAQSLQLPHRHRIHGAAGCDRSAFARTEALRAPQTESRALGH